MSIEEKIRAIKGRKYGGSSLQKGKMYHQLPFKELEKLRHHRSNTRERIARIAQLAKLRGKTVLDIGCSVGGIALGMIEKGAKSVLGVDYDLESIEVAREAARFLGYNNVVKFEHGEITLDWARSLPEYDVILWLSQWQWSVKQKGLKYAKQLLFEISRKGKVMIFESAANDGMARIKGATHEDIDRWLCENTVYENIDRYPSTKGWLKRDIFCCYNPLVRLESTKRAATSIIERIAPDKIKKTFRKSPVDYRWMHKREVVALRRLGRFDCFPKLLGVGNNHIKMSYVGRKSRVDFERMKDQVWRILGQLRRAGITHRDLTDRNFLSISGKKLYLIDFGWCTFAGEKNPPKLNKGILLKTGGLPDEELLLKLFKS